MPERRAIAPRPQRQPTGARPTRIEVRYRIENEEQGGGSVACLVRCTAQETNDAGEVVGARPVEFSVDPLHPQGQALPANIKAALTTLENYCMDRYLEANE